ncbi:hypothetical protein [Myceligenerans indicum]|uniref:Type II toxin-antitoxin system VapC family toxin n=1 Tax=Myceligenerans indicum TaxID=2593663 RepID=A0ABS1LRA3_9MICO|nr:hypothetical protein [Myceligenerans indicum]MBL0888318.1 type II toxin-antitoxin system VapC family toxin [Myceligenerans indicum]
MTRYAIDAPTLLRLVDDDLPVDPAHQLVAPKSIHSDALTRLLRDVRSGVRTEDEALATHERLTSRGLRLLGDRVSRRVAWQLAREHGWDDLHDAEYLAVCRLQADALVTVDHALAARAAGIVPVAPLVTLLPPDTSGR